MTLPDAERARMLAHLEAGYPGEACGILIGEIDGDTRRVVEAISTRNAWAAADGEDGHGLNDRFAIDPADIVRADRSAAKRGLDIIGYFHSHPEWPATPSETDRQWAWPIISFVIVSVRAGRAGELRSWILREDRSQFDEEEVITV